VLARWQGAVRLDLGGLVGEDGIALVGGIHLLEVLALGRVDAGGEA
jgi:hypothetical protein